MKGRHLIKVTSSLMGRLHTSEKSTYHSYTDACSVQYFAYDLATAWSIPATAFIGA